MKEKIAFIDHNFHKKSRSADFLRDIFKREYEISNYWWSLKYQKEIYYNIKDYDNFFFFQSLLPLNDMLKIKDKNVMWAPMYDNLTLEKNFWQLVKYLNIKVLCFSKKVRQIAKKNNCNYLYLKYFIKPEISKKKNKLLNIFFWYRGGIHLKDWINFFNPKLIKIKLFDCPDPGKKNLFLESKIKKKYNIQTFKKSFLKKKEYIKFVKDCDVFISPRKQEGIGMSFIEAMSKGKYVVAFNDSTMNEYINNKKIGIIFPNKNQKINTNFISKNFKYRAINARKIYLDWFKNKNKILIFFKDVSKKSNYSPYFTSRIKINYILEKIKLIIKKFIHY